MGGAFARSPLVSVLDSASDVSLVGADSASVPVSAVEPADMVRRETATMERGARLKGTMILPSTHLPSRDVMRLRFFVSYI